MTTDVADLETALVEALRRMGARVEIFAGADNTIRPRGESEPGIEPFVIEVEGLPNLLHEVAHVVLHGGLERDHGTDFAQIPFRLDHPHGRRLMLEELACCASSCRWHPGELDEAKAWFREQVGIQAIFYGEGDDPGVFLDRVRSLCREHAAERDEVLASAEHGLRRMLREVDSESLGAPRHDRGFEYWWSTLDSAAGAETA